MFDQNTYPQATGSNPILHLNYKVYAQFSDFQGLLA